MKEQNLDQNQQNQYLAFYTQYMQQQQQQTNPYAQIVTNVTENTPTVAQKKTVLSSLVQNYGSESDNDNDDDDDASSSETEERTVIRAPPMETRLVIDKMASYVAKNGADFEAIVRSKGDPRFEFLKETHEFHTYYKSKIKEFGVVVVKSAGSRPKKVIGRFEWAIAGNGGGWFFGGCFTAPVSFSIKKPKDDPPKEIKSALPVEESSEDETVSTTPPLPPPPAAAVAEEKQTEVTTTTAATTPPPPPTPPTTNGLLDEDDPILEMIDLTDELEEKRRGNCLFLFLIQIAAFFIPMLYRSLSC